jgi:hypothetical protein
MSEIKVNKISPRTACGTTTLGDSGDTFTIPAGVTITNNGTQTGFGRTGTVDWVTDSIKTATFTAVSGKGYFCNTAGGAFEVDLPAGSAGSIVSIQDYNNTFDTAALTIDPNGTEKINGGEGSVILNSEGEGITLVYIDSTVGWRSIQDSAFSDVGSNYLGATGGTITTCGNDKIHTFTGPGTFTVTGISPCAANNLVSYMVVAGGGGGGAERGGGGGAGGYRETKSPVTPYTASPLDGYPTPGNRITVTTTGYPITVGAGGPGNSYPPYVNGAQGNPSVFSTITSTGGGAGKGALVNPSNAPNSYGGSGGGGAHNTSDAPGKCGGTGNSPPVTPAQGNNGGNAGPSPGSGGAAGGGGGAGAAGSVGGNCGAAGGAGGIGTNTLINPSTCVGTPGPAAGRYFAGGAGGGAWSSPTPGASSGGSGGGGGGGGPGDTGSSNGTANTGGGGGGGGPGYGGKIGGSGIVIIRYKYQ